MSVRDFAEGNYLEPRHFLAKRSGKYYFIEIYKLFNVTNSTDLGC